MTLRGVKSSLQYGVKSSLQFTILHLAAVNSESEVEAAITVLMEDKIIPTTNKIKDLLYIKSQEKVEVHVDQPMVNQYDSLLELIA